LSGSYALLEAAKESAVIYQWALYRVTLTVTAYSLSMEETINEKLNQVK
jgi:hypothetical protein